MATNDMKAANKTYSGFMALLKWTVPLIALITLFVVTMIAS